MASKFLILVGPTRTGTTSLFRFLAQDHESFKPAFKKETNFFLASAAGQPSSMRKEYLSLFVGAGSSDGRYFLEASPLYFTLPTSIGGHISRVLAEDEVRVLVTLREPGARFVSLFNHSVTKRNVGAPPDFSKFYTRARSYQPDSSATVLEDPDAIAYVEGCYRKVVSEWASCLPEGSLRVLFHESLTDPTTRPEVLAELYEWLDLPGNRLRADSYGLENSSRYVRLESLHALALRLNRIAEPLFNRVPVLRNGMRNLYYSFNERRNSTVDIPGHLLGRLEEAYRTDSVGLYDQVAGISLGPIASWAARVGQSEEETAAGKSRVND